MRNKKLFIILGSAAVLIGGSGIDYSDGTE